jgi:hypothetical protein
MKPACASPEVETRVGVVIAAQDLGRGNFPRNFDPSSERTAARVVSDEGFGISDPAVEKKVVVINERNPLGPGFGHAAEPCVGQALAGFENVPKAGKASLGLGGGDHGGGVIRAIVINHQNRAVTQGLGVLGCNLGEDFPQAVRVVICAND